MILLADNEGPDQTARMHRLIWAFAVRISPKTRFRMARNSYRFCPASCVIIIIIILLHIEGLHTRVDFARHLLHHSQLL